MIHHAQNGIEIQIIPNITEEPIIALLRRLLLWNSPIKTYIVADDPEILTIRLEKKFEINRDCNRGGNTITYICLQKSRKKA